MVGSAWCTLSLRCGSSCPRRMLLLILLASHADALWASSRVPADCVTSQNDVCVGGYNSTRLALKQETFKEFEEVLAFVLADNSVGHYCLIVSTAIPFVIFAILGVFISAPREIRGWPFLFHQLRLVISPALPLKKNHTL